MKMLTALLLSILPLHFLLAQEEPQGNEKVESMKIAFITEKLNLTPKEATVFWPVYNEYDDQIKGIRQKNRERIRAYSDKMNPSDAEAEKFVAENLNVRQQELDLLKKYVGEFKKVLPPVKVARLLTIEQEFKMRLIQIMKENKRAGGPGNRR